MHIGVRLAITATVLMLVGHGAIGAQEQPDPGALGVTGAQEAYLQEKYGLEAPAPRLPPFGGDWGISLKVRK